ncbi:hypothetical protein CK625_02770 [Vandammella animalimorsus]|uniref:Uncharacterized protein n=1 Tax=Vandammella animalimorsus TaxID=2029117 RepID=A0A2A2AKT6_9BURK|nr:hypothetical protein CK625_02770 [Vandammella animalimorsus]
MHLRLWGVFCSNVDKPKTRALAGTAISQAALVMPAKVGIQRLLARERGIGQRQRRPCQRRSCQHRDWTPALCGCDENQRRLQEMPS